MNGGDLAPWILGGMFVVIVYFFGRRDEALVDIREDIKMERLLEWAQETGRLVVTPPCETLPFAAPTQPQTSTTVDVLPDRRLKTTIINHETGEIIEKYAKTD